MGWFGDDSQEAQHYNDYSSDAPHKAKLSHEGLTAAASFYAAKKYEDHVAQNGKPPSHALAKELVAGFAGGFVDKEVESKGLDFIDKERAQREAKKRAEQAYDDNSGNY